MRALDREFIGRADKRKPGPPRDLGGRRLGKTWCRVDARADRRTAERVPGLGDLPIAGRLFSSTTDTTTRSEIVLLITPRLQRTLARPDAGSVEFAAGTEAQTGIPRLGGGAGISASPPFEPPVTVAPGTPSEEGVAAGAAAAPPAQPPAAPVLVPFGGIKPSTQ